MQIAHTDKQICITLFLMKNQTKKGGYMARVTITIPDNLQAQVLKLAKKEGGSVSHTISRLIEMGFLIVNNKNKSEKEESNKKIEEHCQKLIIQMNGIIKELVVNTYQFAPDKISQITQETMLKFNDLKGLHEPT